MKWIPKPPKVGPKLGDRRVQRAFAVFPVKDSKGIRIWLESFNRIEEYRRYTVLMTGVSLPMPLTTEGWVTVEVEHLCSFRRNVQGGYSPDSPCLCGKERKVGVRLDVPLDEGLNNSVKDTKKVLRGVFP